MSFAFNPQHGLIVVNAELEGPNGTAVLRLALDTGATRTLINAGMLMAIGCDLALATTQVQITTGSGIELATLLPVNRLTAFGQERLSFPVLAHTLPATASFDGLLGLDFLRGQMLTVDFRTGQLSLT